MLNQRAKWMEILAWAKNLPEASKPTTLWKDGWSHYDAPHAFQMAGKLTGLDYGPDEDNAIKNYRDWVIEWGMTGWHIFTEGMTHRYLVKGDEVCKTAVMKLVDKRNLSVDYGLNPWGCRENAFQLRAALDYELVSDSEALMDGTSDAIVHKLAHQAISHMEHWVNGSKYYGVNVKPFMVGIVMLAVIEYYERYRGEVVAQGNIPRVLPALNAMADYLWDKCTYPANTIDAGVGGLNPFPYPVNTYLQKAHTDADMVNIPGVITEVTGDRWRFKTDLPGTLPDFYKFNGVVFESVPGDSFMAMKFDPATKMLELTQSYTPNVEHKVGDKFTITSGASAEEGPGPAPDLNHMVAPVYSWLYLLERTTKGMTPAATVLKQRFEGMFDGGTTAHQNPWGHKQWNQSLYWMPRGLAYYDAAEKLGDVMPEVKYTKEAEDNGYLILKEVGTVPPPPGVKQYKSELQDSGYVVLKEVEAVRRSPANAAEEWGELTLNKSKDPADAPHRFARFIKG